MGDMTWDREDLYAATVAGDEIPIHRKRGVTRSTWDGESGWGEEILALLTRPDWHAQAACRGVDPDLMFPVRGDTVPDEVRAMCARCPVRADCLEAGLAHREQPGVWGGTSVSERRLLRQQRRGAA